MSQLDEQIGNVTIQTLSRVAAFMKSFVYGLGEILVSLREMDEKPLKFIGFYIFIYFSSIVYIISESLVEYIPKTENEYVNGFINPITIKVVSILLVVIYIKSCGDSKVKHLDSFNDKFESIGLYSKLVREKVDLNGDKVRIKDYPKLLKTIKKGDTTIYIFGSNGIPLSTWQKKISEIESAFGLGVLEATNKKGSSKVVRLVTAPYHVKEERRKYDEKFEAVGLYRKSDGVKSYPELLESTEDGKKIAYRFKSEGVPIDLWKEKKNEIEASFDTNVVSISYTQNTKKIIEVITVPSKFNIQESYPWKQEYIPKEDFKVVLGEGLLERPQIDFNKTPHVLIGGLTGSGKSVIERCITWQIIKKGAIPFLVDFKGGIELEDFEDFGEVIFERKRLIQILDGLVKEHHARIKTFKEAGVKNIVQYNSEVGESDKLARVFLIVDEIAELLDTTGITDKDEKAIFEKIESKLNTLARLSRATGINMILATQRPDAKVIKGQIKNNLGARISGRMSDKEPSIMVLGSPDAKYLPDIKGRFLFSIGAEPVEFQGYWFTEEDIIKGDYQEGKMLVIENEKIEIKDNVEIVDEDEYQEFDEELDEDQIKTNNEDEETLEQSYEDTDDDVWTIVEPDDVGELDYED